MASEDTTDASTIKYYTRAEVAKYNTATNSWIIIHDKVYDVTKFLKQHPGGEEVILEHAGRDGTEPFEDIGHSSDAREMMEPYKIGELVEEERTKSDDKKERDWANGASNGDSSSNRATQSIPGFNHWLLEILADSCFTWSTSNSYLPLFHQRTLKHSIRLLSYFISITC
uniref:cytochrome b5 isoform X1 n=2 Tax=Vespula vulgaris TaxID=7454 RepID=UPI00213DB095|nr:cytochrome b5 isoform X1 [Vespula vulgaris]